MINVVFRKHPEFRPSGKVTIFGRSLCTAERMSAYAYRRNPNAPNVAGIYLEQAERFGIRGDLAFCQAMLDTQVWRADPQGPPWKPFASAIWSGANPGWTDDEWKRRTDQHLQRLFALASGREDNITCWEDLNGKWALPGYKYGQDIVAIWRNMMEWKGEGEVMEEMEESADFGEPSAGERRAGRSGEAVAEDMQWLADRGCLPSPSPHPERKVTWAEMARLLRHWDNGKSTE